MSAAECFGWYKDDEGHQHPVAIATIRCFKMADGSPGTEIAEGVELIKRGQHCGYMLGHGGACEMYSTEWEAEALP